MMKGPRLLNFKIWVPIPQNDENKRPKVQLRQSITRCIFCFSNLLQIKFFVNLQWMILGVYINIAHFFFYLDYIMRYHLFCSYLYLFQVYIWMTDHLLLCVVLWFS